MDAARTAATAALSAAGALVAATVVPALQAASEAGGADEVFSALRPALYGALAVGSGALWLRRHNAETDEAREIEMEAIAALEAEGIITPGGDGEGDVLTRSSSSQREAQQEGGCCMGGAKTEGCCQDGSRAKQTEGGGDGGGEGECCMGGAKTEGCCQDGSRAKQMTATTTPSAAAAAAAAAGACCQSSSSGGGNSSCCSSSSGDGGNSRGCGGGGCGVPAPRRRPRPKRLGRLVKRVTAGNTTSDTTTTTTTTATTSTGVDVVADSAADGSSALTAPIESAHVLYAGTRGGAKTMAGELAESLSVLGLKASVQTLSEYDPEDLASESALCIFIVSTYEGGTCAPEGKWFHTWVTDAANDFRVDKKLLYRLRYAVFGRGDSVYGKHFNRAARDLDVALAALRAQRAGSTGLGDESAAASEHGGLEADFEAWKTDLLASVTALREGRALPQVYTYESTEDEYEEEEGEGDGEVSLGGGQQIPVVGGGCGNSGGGGGGTDGSGGLLDIESLGGVANELKASREARQAEDAAAAAGTPREMVTPALRAALSKQGYKIVGSHSGVKLCRWTKSMLRGRGGCYKHTFYGIESHRCMETTPSLACANKCVFCWRHHTNPVGTEWRWKTDDAAMIIDGAMQNHYNMVRSFGGAPGVIPQRLREANEIRHCALSLVGEPIMYPQINRFLELLHARGISSFLVTNAQFPEAITNLTPVCQLYVSVDAATPESLKAIDRPLFSDFWPRLLDSLEALGKKGQRTVYRLTIVAGWNDEELAAYAELIRRGRPDFIEVKGVTYCGDSKASSLTMKNVPYHEEIVGFVEKLAQAVGDGYAVACEHEHSNSVLIAAEKFRIDGRWHTWINYDRFHELIASGTDFTAEDYMEATPAWAVRGHEARGFDPIETRHRRSDKRKKADIGGC